MCVSIRVFYFSISRFCSTLLIETNNWLPSTGETLNVIGTHSSLLTYLTYCHINGSSFLLRDSFSILSSVLFYLSVSNPNISNFPTFLLHLRRQHPFLRCQFLWMTPCSRALCIAFLSMRDGQDVLYRYTEVSPLLFSPLLSSPLLSSSPPLCLPSSLTTVTAWSKVAVWYVWIPRVRPHVSPHDRGQAAFWQPDLWSADRIIWDQWAGDKLCLNQSFGPVISEWQTQDVLHS